MSISWRSYLSRAPAPVASGALANESAGVRPWEKVAGPMTETGPTGYFAPPDLRRLERAGILGDAACGATGVAVATDSVMPSLRGI